jgi:hypothetical protein
MLEKHHIKDWPRAFALYITNRKNCKKNARRKLKIYGLETAAAAASTEVLRVI